MKPFILFLFQAFSIILPAYAQWTWRNPLPHMKYHSPWMNSPQVCTYTG